MTHNLTTPQTGSLPYPHCLMVEGDEASIVTHPDRLIAIGDIVCYPNQKNLHKVLGVLEQRTARGEHSVDFTPIFQRLNVEEV